jgi:hypothetical protein
VKEDYESLKSVDGFGGVWSVSYCPKSKIVFDSCNLESLVNPSGLRVFKANAMPEVENDRQVPAPYDQIMVYEKKLIISSDPLSFIHRGFFRSIVRNPVEGYKYVISVYDDENKLIKNGLLYGKSQFDIGNLMNNTNTNKNYTVEIKEYDLNNNETPWTQSKIIVVEPHMYMPTNEYTPFNKSMFDQMHPPTTMPNGYDLSFTHILEELVNPQTLKNGYKINLSITSNYHIISFEELSLNNTPGWDNSSPIGLFSGHSHCYVWEDITGQDSQGTNYQGYKWVKKGRTFEENWIEESILKDKWVKIRFSSNNHGTIFNSDGNEASIIFAVGNPNEPYP